jgi:hypothetical protein
MPQLAAIAVADGAASPVTHTFSPTTSNGQKALLHNRAASLPRGYESLNVEVTQPGSATAAYRVIGSFLLPTVASVEGLDTVVRQNKVDFTFNFSQDSTEQDRKNARVMLANLLANALITTVIEKLEPLY